MGKSKQKYKKEWEKDFDRTETDGAKNLIGDWCSPVKDDEFSAFCTACRSKISVANAGKQAILQHANGAKHTEAIKSLKKCKQTTINSFIKPATNATEDLVLAAEIRWASFLAENDLPMALSDKAPDLFRVMFPDSAIAKEFSCARTKASYILTDGIGDYEHSNLVEKMKNTNFSILIDESTQIQGKKFLHILSRFYDTKKSDIVTYFYKAVVVNNANAENIVSAINSAFEEDGIPWKHVIQVMSDSPNVMRGKTNGVLAIIKKKYAPHMIDIGGCSLHHIHNAVSYATGQLGDDIEEFVVDIFAFFKHRSGLWEDYAELQSLLDIPEHHILRFVSTRWLVMLPVVNRLLEQWVCLKEFFLSFLPKKHANVVKQERTKRIVGCLQDPALHLKLLFLQAVLPQFHNFEKVFQSQGCKVHLLYAEFYELLKQTMAQFLKPEQLENVKSMKKLVSIDYAKIINQLPDHKLAIGHTCRETLTRCKEL